MMESSHLDLQHQEELRGSSSLASSSPSFHFVGRNHGWSQDLLLNSGDLIPNANGVLSSSRDFMRLISHDVTPSPPLTSHMVQDLGFQWGGNAAESYMNHQAHLSKLKEELSACHLMASQVKNEPPGNTNEVDNEKLFLRTLLSSDCSQMNGLQPPSGDLAFDSMSLGNLGRGSSFSMVLPSANISSLNPPPPPFTASLGVDLQALDLLASARFGRTLCHPNSLSNMALFREDRAYGFGQHWQEHAQGPPTSLSKMPSSISGVTEPKRVHSNLEYKSSQSAPKKPRFEPRSSFTPFKVRKEKLGDRIAALQQLVAPFGKTDTASVLMEAIGYIKFLQDQVETLSVPYMRSSNSEKLRTQGASTEEIDEPKPDLRSRGLCLVPLSCTSYVTNENGGVWSPPNYRGGT